jgi:hypothetical protein
MSGAAPSSKIQLAFFLEPVAQKWKLLLRKGSA